MEIVFIHTGVLNTAATEDWGIKPDTSVDSLDPLPDEL